VSATGWYVHHHGRGHLTRFLAIRRYLAGPVTVLSSLEAPAHLPDSTTWLRLPRDDDAMPDGTALHDADPQAGGALHWAPLRHPGHHERMAVIAAACASGRFERFVVDVSVEVAMLVRLLGMPTVVMAQPGERDDEPHRLAYRAATRIVVPWAEGLQTTPVLEANRERARWVGAISRFDERMPAAGERLGPVLVLGAADGPAPTPGAVHLDGAEWVDDPWALLSGSEVVVTAAGQNALADLAAAGARAVVVPQQRPFGEQRASAEVLAREGLAVVLDAWPSAAEWPAHLERARALQPDWSRWAVHGGALRAARAIERVGA